MDVTEMQKVLSGVQADPVVGEKGVKEEVKPTPSVSPTAPVAEPVKPADDPEAQIEGLKAELARRKGNAEEVKRLEAQLEYMRGQLDTVLKSKEQDPITTALSKMDDETLITRKDEWQEELISLRGKFDRAEELNDTTAMQELGARITNARRIIKAIQLEDRSRVERKMSSQKEVEEVTDRITRELTSMRDIIVKAQPGMDNEESDLWKAGELEFKTYPEVMRRLGPMASTVAVALAILKNPELAGKKQDTEVRKEVLNSLEKGLKKALTPGTKATASSPTPVEYTVETGEGLAAFNRLVDKYKGG